MDLLGYYILAVQIFILASALYNVFKRNFKIIIPAIITFILTFLLSALDRYFGIKVDELGSALYITIILMANYLGSGFKYYDKYVWWDRVLHLFSGISFVSFGVGISDEIMTSTKLGILLFSFSFSVAVHSIWEASEYISDRLFHTDHQRWQKRNKTHNHLSNKAIQPAGLVDTMNDMLLGIIGAIGACIFYWYR